MKRQLKHLFNISRSVIRDAIKRGGRSPEWRFIEKTKVKEVQQCEICGSNKRLQVHHVKPFARFPELELEESNLVVLCMGPNECHLQCGHGGSFRAYNPDVRKLIQAAQNGKELCLLQEEARFARLKI
jgi:5-methylcytosine-specific restriction endonuclease McrA